MTDHFQLNRFLREVERPPHDMPTGELYHYTSAEGCEGIVSRRRVWATHFQHLNDTEELERGYEIIQEVVNELASEGQPPHRGLFGRLAEGLRKHNLVALRTPIFIASFSEAPDDLSQWRAYSANGKGYALGFRLRYASNEDPEAPYNVGLLQCEYKDDAFRARVRRECAAVREAMLRRNVQGPAWVELERQARLALMVQAAMLAARRKHPAFAGEREWRVIAEPNETRRDELVKYRQTALGRTPYLELPLTTEDTEPFPLTRVVVGPTQDPERGARRARELLTQNAFSEVPVERSGIPYRG